MCGARNLYNKNLLLLRIICKIMENQGLPDVKWPSRCILKYFLVKQFDGWNFL